MSLVVTRAVWLRGPKDLALRATLHVIGDHANDEGEDSFPGVDLIAEKTCCSKRTALRNLKKLEVDEWISVERRAPIKGKSYSRNRYRVSRERLGGFWKPDDKAMALGGSDTAMSRGSTKPGDIQRTNQVTPEVEPGDKSGKPPAPPYRSNHPEPSYEPEPSAFEEAVSLIAASDPTLSLASVRVEIAKVLAAEVQRGERLDELVRTLSARWRKFSAARAAGKFEIHGWGPAKFFGEGHWRNEQKWPWRNEFKPEPPMKYVDPSAVYRGADYERPAIGVAS